MRDRLAHSFARKRKDSFWSGVKRLNKATVSSCAFVVDGVSGSGNISNLFAAECGALLNRYPSSSRCSILDSVKASMSESQLCDILFTEEDILEALSQLKPGKSDAAGISSEHLRLPQSAFAVPLASFLTLIMPHGYMPQCLRDSVLIPAPKSRILQAVKVTVLLLSLPESVTFLRD